MESASDTERLIDPERLKAENNKKKVRFSNTVSFYKSGPATKILDDGLELENVSKPVLLSLEDMVSHTKLGLRTPTDQPIQCSFASLFLLFAILFVFAVLLWYLIQKLLILEIESQVQATPNSVTYM